LFSRGLVMQNIHETSSQVNNIRATLLALDAVCEIMFSTCDVWPFRQFAVFSRVQGIQPQYSWWPSKDPIAVPHIAQFQVMFAALSHMKKSSFLD
jgi:hypothetical protein